MGRDKSLLVYHQKPQREHLFEVLQECCHQAFTSCRKGQQVPSHLSPLEDSHNVPGPLNGILTALAFMPQVSWLVVAVDMPFVTASSLQFLLANRDKNKLATCFRNAQSGEPEPLLTLWEQDAYSHLLRFTGNGNTSPREFLKSHPVKIILPPDEKVLLNFNDPTGAP